MSAETWVDDGFRLPRHMEPAGEELPLSVDRDV
jgi:hypothetical protein